MAKSKRQGNPYVKEALRILAVLAGTGLVLGLVFALSRCKGGRDEAPPAHSAVVNDVVVKDTETGISYVRCPIGIGANTLKDKFLTVGGENSGIALYTIAFEDSARFLSEAKNALGGAYVYRAEDVPEITLESFKPVSAGIFMDGINAPIDNFYGKQAAENADFSIEDGVRYVDCIKEALTVGEDASPTGEFTGREFYIRLYSEDFPGLYYEVVFCTDENGVSYLRDMVTGKLAESPDELTVRMIG